VLEIRLPRTSSIAPRGNQEKEKGREFGGAADTIEQGRKGHMGQKSQREEKHPWMKKKNEVKA